MQNRFGSHKMTISQHNPSAPRVTRVSGQKPHRLQRARCPLAQLRSCRSMCPQQPIPRHTATSPHQRTHVVVLYDQREERHHWFRKLNALFPAYRATLLLINTHDIWMQISHICVRPSTYSLKDFAKFFSALSELECIISRTSIGIYSFNDSQRCE